MLACSGGALHHLRDVSRAVDPRPRRALRRRSRPTPPTSPRWRWQLFDATASLHGLPDDAREYLEAGALLANVGLVISHSKHHLHSYYVIRNSELTGLTDTEIEIIAQIARYHRKSAPKASHAEFAATLARRSAAGAHPGRHPAGGDRARPQPRRAGAVARWRTCAATGWSIEAEAKRGKEISLELYTANERSSLLEEVLGQRVDIVAAAAARLGRRRAD